MLKLTQAGPAVAPAGSVFRHGQVAAGDGGQPGDPHAPVTASARGAGDGLHPEAAGCGPSPPDRGGQVVALLLADVAPAWRMWGWSRIVRGSGPLRGQAGLRWARVMGSGHEGGFGLRPSASHQGVLGVFDTLASAQDFLWRSPLATAYRARSRQCLTALLQPWSVRGSWGGQGITVPAAKASVRGATSKPEAPVGPVVALTRASIRPLKAVPFWSLAPAAQASLRHAPGCRLAAGLGEAPLLRQCTVSLWDDLSAMDAYARSGAHLAAIRAAAVHGFFSESMFVRFSVLDIAGCWQGQRHG